MSLHPKATLFSSIGSSFCSISFAFPFPLSFMLSSLSLSYASVIATSFSRELKNMLRMMRVDSTLSPLL